MAKKLINAESPIVLIVDDETQILELISRGMRKLGYQVRVAIDGAGALEILNQTSIALAILDLDLPDCSGLELCRKIKDHVQHALVPVIICSGRPRDAMWEEAREAGAIAYFEKPFDMMDLMLSAKFHIYGEEKCMSRIREAQNPYALIP